MSARSELEELAREIPALSPLDEHNRALAELAHPPGWTNPEPPARGYDLVVLGAGTAGLVTAAGAAGLGARVALVERGLMGGDCLNVGCVPSKALLRCARAVADVRDAARFGVRLSGEAELDFAAVMERMRRLRARIAPNDSAARFRELGVDVHLGSARFADRRTVEVGGRHLRFACAVIATGARAAEPAVPGLASAGYLTNETLFSLTELPRRLGVIGGGPIGCEMAQAFARFGARVQIVEAGPRLLARDEPEAAAIVERALARDGVEIVLGAQLVEVRRGESGKVLVVECAGTRRELPVDEILLGVGRAPNVEGLALERAGVTYDPRRGVQVDDFLRTSQRGIYAAGDVCSPYKFTHAADAMARIAIQNALFSLGPLGRARFHGSAIPWCTYTDPEVAHVGIDGKEARERGAQVVAFRVPLAELDRAVLDGEEEGALLVHAEKRRGRILGATLVARHAGEMISEIGLAIRCGAGMKTLVRTIHPYPTRAEVFRRAADAFQRTRLTPGARRALRALLALRRRP